MKLRDRIESALSNVSLRFVTHFTSESWGDAILIMEENGNAFARLYWYSDDNTTVYLDRLSVDVKVRKKGYGTELQKLREDIGILLGAKFSCLWVRKDTWMYEWYLRRGYEDWILHEQEKDSIWMRKKLV